MTASSTASSARWLEATPDFSPFVVYGLPEREDAALEWTRSRTGCSSRRAVVEALGERAPTVLVFQDLHWAGHATIAIIDRLVTTITVRGGGGGGHAPFLRRYLGEVREIELEALSPVRPGRCLVAVGGRRPRLSWSTS